MSETTAKSMMGLRLARGKGESPSPAMASVDQDLRDLHRGVQHQEPEQPVLPAADAVRDTRAPQRPSVPCPAAGIEMHDVHLKMSGDLAAELDRLLASYRQVTRSRMQISEMARCMIRAMLHAESELMRAVGELGPLRKPSQKRDFLAEREAFEQVLTASMVRGLRATSELPVDQGSLDLLRRA